MKKKIFGILLCLLVAVLVTGCNIKKDEKKEETGFYIDNLDEDNDGLPDGGEYRIEDGKILKGDEVIFDSNKNNKDDYYEITDVLEIPNKKKLKNINLSQYLKLTQYEIYKDSFDEVKGDRLHQLMLCICLPYNPYVTKDEISKIAKIYFDVDNYELPVGTYHTTRWGVSSVLRYEDTYIRVSESGINFYDAYLLDPLYTVKSYEVKGDELIVVSDLVEYKEKYYDEDPDEIEKVYGTQTMYLEYKKDGLIIKKVEYVSNE